MKKFSLRAPFSSEGKACSLGTRSLSAPVCYPARLEATLREPLSLEQVMERRIHQRTPRENTQGQSWSDTEAGAALTRCSVALYSAVCPGTLDSTCTRTTKIIHTQFSGCTQALTNDPARACTHFPRLTTTLQHWKIHGSTYLAGTRHKTIGGA